MKGMGIVDDICSAVIKEELEERSIENYPFYFSHLTVYGKSLLRIKVIPQLKDERKKMILTHIVNKCFNDSYN